MKYFIYLQYDGTDYHGWQTQPDAVTVQETIEQKLSMLLRRKVFIVGAGRTDAGVHARQMVAHFAIGPDSENEKENSLRSYDNDNQNQNENSLRSYENDNENEKENSLRSYHNDNENQNSLRSYENDNENQNEKENSLRSYHNDTLRYDNENPNPNENEKTCEEGKSPFKGDLEGLSFKLNQVLPPDIYIQKIVPVRDDAHARFSPISRTYRYYITTRKPLYDRRSVMRIYEPLDIELMNHACAKLFCYQDFTSFSKLHTDVKTNNCKIMEAYWSKAGNHDCSTSVNEAEYVFTIKADRFLRNMVRAIVGTLIQVGKHKMTVKEFTEIIERKNRCSAGDSVPACGLFLEEIEYPEDIFLQPEE